VICVKCFLKKVPSEFCLQSFERLHTLKRFVTRFSVKFYRLLFLNKQAVKLEVFADTKGKKSSFGGNGCQLGILCVTFSSCNVVG